LTEFLSDNLSSGTISQYSHEILNSLNYIYIAAFLKNKGLDGLGKIFEEQFNEEISHSKLIYDFLTDLNIKFSIVPIDGVDFPINSIMDIATKYDERERATTENLEELLQISISDGNGIAQMFFQQMVDRQRKEMEEVFTFMDRSILCGDDWFKAFLWSQTLS
jgi:ferritin